MGLRVLVTGAAGFIGSTVTDRLLADGHEVIGIDDLSHGQPANLAAAGTDPAFSFERFDITDPGLTALVGRIGPDAVCHLAAQIDVRTSLADPLLDARVNVLGTINVLEAARLANVQKVVFTSSGGSIYGTPSHLPVDETAPMAPESPYAASKCADEIYLNVYRTTYGLASTSLALANVFGPRQDPHSEAGVVTIFAVAMLKGSSATIFGDGLATRDYVYVDDVADAFARAILRGNGDGLRFNIGTGVQTSVRELYTRVAAVTGAPDRPHFADPRLGELQAIALDTALAGRELGWQATVGLDEGLTRTVRWLRGELPASAA